MGAAPAGSRARCCSAAAIRWARARRSRCSARAIRRAAGIDDGEPHRGPARQARERGRPPRRSRGRAARVADVPRRDRRRPVPRRRRRGAARRAREPAADGRRHAPRLGGLAGGRVRGAPGAAGARGPALGRPRHGAASSTPRSATCATSRFMVLALARPDVDERFPEPVAGARAAGHPPRRRCSQARQREAGARGAGRRSPTRSSRRSSRAPTATRSIWRS